MLFYDPVYRPIKPNKIKVAYMRACMRYKYDHFIKRPDDEHQIKKAYIQYDEVDAYSFLDVYTHITMYDPTDIPLLAKYRDICKKKNTALHILESNSFLMNKEDMDMYAARHKEKATRHSTYYNVVKAKLGILKDVSNMDKYNRSPLSNIDIPYEQIAVVNDKEYIRFYEEAIHYALAHFKDHIGTKETLHNLFMYPISSRAAYLHFKRFLRNKLAHFGKYQDAISKDNSVLNHSCISACLNIGIVDPERLVDMTMQYSKKNDISLNSLEGFIRQVIGWREYMRFLYVYFRDDMITANIPENKNYFTPETAEQWYDGTTGIYPLDNEIKKAIATGYSHHIVRLMMFMNLLILSSIHPYIIYKWFMEVISIDAYEWVMIPNIYAMGYFYNKATTRPYLCKSNYIVKMSDYKKDGHWDVIWDSMFDRFIKQKTKKYVFWYMRNI